MRIDHVGITFIHFYLYIRDVNILYIAIIYMVQIEYFNKHRCVCVCALYEFICLPFCYILCVYVYIIYMRTEERGNITCFRLNIYYRF